MSGEFGRFVGQASAKFRPAFGRTWTRLIRLWIFGPNLAEPRPISGCFGPNLAKLTQNRSFPELSACKHSATVRVRSTGARGRARACRPRGRGGWGRGTARRPAAARHSRKGPRLAPAGPGRAARPRAEATAPVHTHGTRMEHRRGGAGPPLEGPSSAGATAAPHTEGAAQHIRREQDVLAPDHEAGSRCRADPGRAAGKPPPSPVHLRGGTQGRGKPRRRARPARHSRPLRRNAGRPTALQSSCRQQCGSPGAATSQPPASAVHHAPARAATSPQRAKAACRGTRPGRWGPRTGFQSCTRGCGAAGGPRGSAARRALTWAPRPNSAAHSHIRAKRGQAWPRCLPMLANIGHIGPTSVKTGRISADLAQTCWTWSAHARRRIGMAKMAEPV